MLRLVVLIGIGMCHAVWNVWLYQDQVDVCKHVVYHCVKMKRDISRMTDAQHAAESVVELVALCSLFVFRLLLAKKHFDALRSSLSYLI